MIYLLNQFGEDSPMKTQNSPQNDNQGDKQTVSKQNNFQYTKDFGGNSFAKKKNKCQKAKQKQSRGAESKGVNQKNFIKMINCFADYMTAVDGFDQHIKKSNKNFSLFVDDKNFRADLDWSECLQSLNQTCDVPRYTRVANFLYEKLSFLLPELPSQAYIIAIIYLGKLTSKSKRFLLNRLNMLTTLFALLSIASKVTSENFELIRVYRNKMGAHHCLGQRWTTIEFKLLKELNFEVHVTKFAYDSTQKDLNHKYADQIKQGLLVLKNCIQLSKTQKSPILPSKLAKIDNLLSAQTLSSESENNLPSSCESFGSIKKQQKKISVAIKNEDLLFDFSQIFEEENIALQSNIMQNQFNKKAEIESQ